MIQKLNNIVHNKTKFNQKVENRQVDKIDNQFEKNLESITNSTNKNQKNSKTKKKNKALNDSSKNLSSKKDVDFIPFSHKNLPRVIPQNENFESIILNDITPKIFGNDSINIEINLTDKDKSIMVEKPANELISLPVHLENILNLKINHQDNPEILESKIKIINELIGAFSPKSEQPMNIRNHLNENKLEGNLIPVKTEQINPKDLNLQGQLTFNEEFTTEEEQNGNKILSKNSDKKDEKSELKNNLNEFKKEDANILQKVDKDTISQDKEPKKFDAKINFEPKNKSELAEKNVLNDLIKEHITEISVNSKNNAQPSASKLTTYTYSGQVRVQEFAQTTLQMVRATPDNTTSTANLVLKPESLGTLFVQISMTENRAKINIMADSSEAIKTIEHQIGALKEKLAQNGILTDSIDIGLKSKDDGDKLSNQYQFSKQKEKKEKEEMKDFIRSFKYLRENDNDFN